MPTEIPGDTAIPFLMSAIYHDLPPANMSLERPKPANRISFARGDFRPWGHHQLIDANRANGVKLSVERFSCQRYTRPIANERATSRKRIVEKRFLLARDGSEMDVRDPRDVRSNSK